MIYMMRGNSGPIYYLPLQGVLCDTKVSLVVLRERDFAASTNDTSSSGSDKTGLLTTRCVSPDSCGVTNVLMVTTTVRMLDGVHCNTSDAWPVSLFSMSSIVGVCGLENWLVSSGTTGNNTNHGSAATNDGFADTGWESNSGLFTVFGMSDNDS